MYRLVLITANGEQYCDSEQYETYDDAYAAYYENNFSNTYCEPNESGKVIDFDVEEW